MTLLTCPECGEAVSSAATTCPHCGLPNPSAAVRAQELEQARLDAQPRAFTLFLVAAGVYATLLTLAGLLNSAMAMGIAVVVGPFVALTIVIVLRRKLQRYADSVGRP